MLTATITIETELSGPVQEGDRLSRLVQEARQLLAETPQLVSPMLKQALEALSVADMAADTRPPSAGLAPWQVRNVKAFVDANVGESIGIDDLASLCRLSVSHFHRAFKSSFGETPYAYVLRQRMALAARLIAETSDPLSQIALDCGLTDQAHLSNLFRKAHGVSPKVWRSMNWEKAAAVH